MPKLSEVLAASAPSNPMVDAMAGADATPRVRLSDVLAQQGPSLQEQAQQRMLDETPALERAFLGAGHGFQNVVDAVTQMGAHAGASLGLVSPETVAARDAIAADHARDWVNTLGNDTAAGLGSFAGEAATTWPLGGPVAKASKLLGPAAEGVIGKLMQTLGEGAIGGGAVAPIATPVTDPNANFAGAKLGQIGEGAMTGAATNAALRGLGAAAETAMNLKTLPTRLAAGKKVTAAAQDNAPASPEAAFIAESDRLANETGVPFTPGQATGSKGLTAAEQKLRQSPKTADTVFEGDQQAAAALDSYVSRMLRNTSASARSPEEAGDFARRAIRGKIADITRQRNAVANSEYGTIRSITGGADVVQPKNANDLLQGLVDEYGGVGAPGADAIANFAKKQLANVSPAAQRQAERIANSAGVSGETAQLAQDAANATAPAEGNLDKLMKLRSFLSKVAGGQAKISGENVDRKIARDLLGAIDQDFDDAADVAGGHLGDMLKAANQHYKEASQQIDYLQRSPLGKLLGEDIKSGGQYGIGDTIPPEKIIARVKTMTPSEVATTKAMMRDADPEAWQAVKRRVVEDALEQARVAAPSSGANTLAVNPNAFVRGLNQHTAHGQAWAEALLDPNELAQMKNAVAAARRLGDRTGYNSSGTGPNIEQALGRIENAASTSSISGLARRGAVMAANMFTTKRLARAMTDPDGRRLLLQLDTLPEGSADARKLAARLMAIMTVGDTEENKSKKTPEQETE
jgi:hypothetical protein